ncbi:hypothetical protein HHL28_12955 [Aerophototrophica crusticola]|uniref:Prolyl 4-hydroxylase alpha subunit Fe(2+) 2OG dioxygenase domain-containing protein n=1 Tax=Aerophototrophica crusticola TaxID=1709002 RepID=A0A858R9Q6_9PROT|nr:hypothetical protein HHL28_12955 [Rhodospirillaceae bacterium B3]
MRSVLSGITASDIRPDPFPHVLVPDALDGDLYAALADSFPSLETLTWAGGRHGSNRRYEMNAKAILEHDGIAPAWKRFLAHHASPAFYGEVVSLFRDHWPEALLRALDGSLLGHATGLVWPGAFDAARIALDARFEVNTPVTGPASVSRGPHLDRPERLYTGLLYFRHPDDDSEGGELVLYRWQPDSPRNTSHFQLPDTAVEEVARIPYRANQLVMFPNGIDALHGVGLRQPTPHLRRYVFMTAELATPWLFPPGEVPS